ncbi:MAG TPA: CPBP family intramembrane glutamic endopeptidase [Candidatus Dormibacteraeota bacterium]|nr:CPBP family intramembrane glutamic endopeptidase [Candidatus Dormibacteraeota bacterium]
MSEAILWALLVVTILGAQAVESPSRQPAADPLRPGQARPPMAEGVAIARIMIAVAAGLVVAWGLVLLAVPATGISADQRRHDIVAGALQITAGLVSLALFYGGTRGIPGVRRLREGAPISWLAILLFLESLALNLTPTGSSTPGGSVTTPVQPSSGPTAESLMLGSIPFLAIGIAAVGPYVRRNVREAAERLGLWPLRLPWWVIGLAIGILLVPVGDWVAGVLAHLTSPQCVQSANQAQQQIIGTGRTALEQIGVAVAAAVGEETLFRGALQPRFGIFLSSALWASFHLQYACNNLPSTSNLYILLLGFVFGALRKKGGLWPAIIAHAAYDAIILLGWLGTS